MGNVFLVHAADISGRKVRAGMTRRKPEAVFVTVNGRYRVEVGEGFEGGTL